MELREPDLKPLDTLQHHRGQKRGAVCQKQRIETPSDPIVVEHGGARLAQADERALEGGGPLGEPVEGGTLDEDVTNEEQDRLGVGELLGFGCRQILGKEICEADMIEEPIDDRKSSYSLGVQA